MRELITRVVEEGGITTDYDYDLLKQITLVTDADENKTVVTYDKRGRRTSILNPDTGLVSMWYDPMGNLIRKQTIISGVRSNFPLDKWGQMKLSY